jgi:class 3 adenylate cyclase
VRVGVRLKVSAFAAALVVAVAAGMAYFFVLRGAERREAETIARFRDAARLLALLQRVGDSGTPELDFAKIDTLVRNAAEIGNGLVYATLAPGGDDPGADGALERGRLSEELWRGLGSDLAAMLDGEGETYVLAKIAAGEVAFGGRVKDFRTVLPGGKVLRLGFDLSGLDAAQAADLRANLLVTAGALLLGLAGSLLLGRALVSRIELLAHAMRRVATGDLSPRVEVRGGDEIGVAETAFNVMADELRKKERYKETLGRYVSEDVAERFMGAEGAAGAAGAADDSGMEREATVLFLDVRGFTALGRALAPRALLAVLNEFFAEVVDVILANDGTIFKLVGDSIMAVFGAPAPVGEPELRAVRAALAIQAAVERRNTGRRAAGEIEIGVGIGIATGKVVAGNVGSARRLAYTVVGPAVNLAARIEETARRGQVVVAEGTWKRVAARASGVELGPTALRALGEPVPLYEVTGLVVE